MPRSRPFKELKAKLEAKLKSEGMPPELLSEQVILRSRQRRPASGHNYPRRRDDKATITAALAMGEFRRLAPHERLVLMAVAWEMEIPDLLAGAAKLLALKDRDSLYNIKAAAMAKIRSALASTPRVPTSPDPVIIAEDDF